MKARILLAENDPDYRRSLRQLLELEDYQVQEAPSFEEAMALLDAASFDLAIVDLRLSEHENDRDLSGLKVAKAAADRGVAAVMVTSYPSVEATRLALRAQGSEPLADDFIPKTDGAQAVLHAIEVVLRRRDMLRPELSPGLEIDTARGLVYRDGEQILLSRLQYSLLAYMDAQQGAVCSPEELIKAVYDEDLLPDEASTDKRLARLVERVREKIELDLHHPRYLVTAYGRGFRLDVEGGG